MSITFTHHGSRRVTSSISYHSFTSTPDGASSPPPSNARWLRPAQSVTLLFSKDLDPVNALLENERRCKFTPYGANKGQGIDILTRNGRITGLMGLPRPYQALTASIIDVGGGFPENVLTSIDVADQVGACCIAGGTGIAPFLTMEGNISPKLSLLWSVRSDDFELVEFVLEEKLICVERWATATIFVTSGEDSGGLATEKPSSWWTEKFMMLRKKHSQLTIEKRRIMQEDLESNGKTAFFCGSKSLEWQIRMWSMGTVDVYCTET